MSLIKHSSILIVGVIISNGLAYVFHFIAGKMLGPEGYGEFGALMALLLVVALLENLLLVVELLVLVELVSILLFLEQHHLLVEYS